MCTKGELRWGRVSFCIDQHYTDCFMHIMYSWFGYCSPIQYATGLIVKVSFIGNSMSLGLVLLEKLFTQTNQLTYNIRKILRK